jgi:hypothetical protein
MSTKPNEESTKPNEELNAEQLEAVSGGESDGGGFRRSIHPGRGPTEGLLGDKDLSTVSGGESDGGGFRRIHPDLGPTEGLIE